MTSIQLHWLFHWHIECIEAANDMKYPPLTQLNGVFGVIKPYGLTAAQTCNRIRADLVKGTGDYLVEILVSGIAGGGGRVDCPGFAAMRGDKNAVIMGHQATHDFCGRQNCSLPQMLISHAVPLILVC